MINSVFNRTQIFSNVLFYEAVIELKLLSHYTNITNTNQSLKNTFNKNI